MSISHEIKGDKLIITCDISGKPYVSKSAVAKAEAKGQDASKLEAMALATSGGFVRAGNVKYSLNVNLA